ncbi:unnamed protein product [Moneuplotes crassus]|uniref:Uncharacterized protein n=1 Tax=Euplotes crassus TaxID=5936 RepID=A0AAD1XPC5_EUPCR|nr:unnamed protein product [Moneuplotes crassus]
MMHMHREYRSILNLFKVCRCFFHTQILVGGVIEETSLDSSCFLSSSSLVFSSSNLAFCDSNHTLFLCFLLFFPDFFKIDFLGLASKEICLLILVISLSDLLFPLLNL